MAILNTRCKKKNASMESLKVRNHRVLSNSKRCNNAVGAWAQSGYDDVISHAEGISDVIGIEIDEFVFNYLINVKYDKVANI